MPPVLLLLLPVPLAVLGHVVAKAVAALLVVVAAAAAARQPCEHDSSPISFVDRSSLLYDILLIPLPTTAAT